MNPIRPVQTNAGLVTRYYRVRRMAYYYDFQYLAKYSSISQPVTCMR